MRECNTPQWWPEVSAWQTRAFAEWVGASDAVGQTETMSTEPKYSEPNHSEPTSSEAMRHSRAGRIEVRPIEVRDEQRWHELFTAYGVFYETDFDSTVLDGVWAWLLDAHHPLFCLVAELDGRVVGFAHVREQPDTFTAGPGWYLDDLFTEPEARGTGAATALIAAIEQHARAHGGGTIRWITAADNEPAQRVYDRLATRATWVTYELETGSGTGNNAAE